MRRRIAFQPRAIRSGLVAGVFVLLLGGCESGPEDVREVWCTRQYRRCGNQ